MLSTSAVATRTRRQHALNSSSNNASHSNMMRQSEESKQQQAPRPRPPHHSQKRQLRSSSPYSFISLIDSDEDQTEVDHEEGMHLSKKQKLTSTSTTAAILSTSANLTNKGSHAPRSTPLSDASNDSSRTLVVDDECDNNAPRSYARKSLTFPSTTETAPPLLPSMISPPQRFRQNADFMTMHSIPILDRVEDDRKASKENGLHFSVDYHPFTMQEEKSSGSSVPSVAVIDLSYDNDFSTEEHNRVMNAAITTDADLQGDQDVQGDDDSLRSTENVRQHSDPTTIEDDSDSAFDLTDEPTPSTSTSRTISAASPSSLQPKRKIAHTPPRIIPKPAVNILAEDSLHLKLIIDEEKEDFMEGDQAVSILSFNGPPPLPPSNRTGLMKITRPSSDEMRRANSAGGHSIFDAASPPFIPPQLPSRSPSTLLSQTTNLQRTSSSQQRTFASKKPQLWVDLTTENEDETKDREEAKSNSIDRSSSHSHPVSSINDATIPAAPSLQPAATLQEVQAILAELAEEDNEVEAEDDEEEAVAKSSRVGAQYQAGVPRLLTASEQKVASEENRSMEGSPIFDCRALFFALPDDREAGVVAARILPERYRTAERRARRKKKNLEDGKEWVSNDEDSEDDDEEDSQKQWEVEEILYKKLKESKKKKKNSSNHSSPATSPQLAPSAFEYGVWWKGYPKEDCTIEPYENVKNLLDNLPQAERDAIPVLEEYNNRTLKLKVAAAASSSSPVRRAYSPQPSSSSVKVKSKASSKNVQKESKQHQVRAKELNNFIQETKEEKIMVRADDEMDIDVEQKGEEAIIPKRTTRRWNTEGKEATPREREDDSLWMLHPRVTPLATSSAAASSPLSSSHLLGPDIDILHGEIILSSSHPLSSDDDEHIANKSASVIVHRATELIRQNSSQSQVDPDQIYLNEDDGRFRIDEAKEIKALHANATGAATRTTFRKM